MRDDITSSLNSSNPQLADIDNAAISKDFALTREGREPAREMIMARLAKEPIFAANMDAALNMLSCRCVGYIIWHVVYSNEPLGQKPWMRF